MQCKPYRKSICNKQLWVIICQGPVIPWSFSTPFCREIADKHMFRFHGNYSIKKMLENVCNLISRSFGKNRVLSEEWMVIWDFRSAKFSKFAKLFLSLHFCTWVNQAQSCRPKYSALLVQVVIQLAVKLSTGLLHSIVPKKSFTRIPTFQSSLTNMCLLKNLFKAVGPEYKIVIGRNVHYNVFTILGLSQNVQKRTGAH